MGEAPGPRNLLISRPPARCAANGRRILTSWLAARWSVFACRRHVPPGSREMRVHGRVVVLRPAGLPEPAPPRTAARRRWLSLPCPAVGVEKARAAALRGNCLPAGSIRTAWLVSSPRCSSRLSGPRGAPWLCRCQRATACGFPAVRGVSRLRSAWRSARPRPQLSATQLAVLAGRLSGRRSRRRPQRPQACGCPGRWWRGAAWALAGLPGWQACQVGSWELVMRCGWRGAGGRRGPGRGARPGRRRPARPRRR